MRAAFYVINNIEMFTPHKTIKEAIIASMLPEEDEGCEFISSYRDDTYEYWFAMGECIGKFKHDGK